MSKPLTPPANKPTLLNKPTDPTNTSSAYNKSSSLLSSICNSIGDYSESQTGCNNNKSMDDTYTSHKNGLYKSPTTLKGSSINLQHNSLDNSKSHQDKGFQNNHYLHPQRVWDSEKIIPNSTNSNNNNLSNNNHQKNYNILPPQNQSNNHKVRDSWITKNPVHVTERTKHFSTVGPDGSTLKTTTSVTKHDGIEVLNRITQDIRLNRINQLEASGTPAALGGSKRPETFKLFITLVDPDTTPEAMENSLLHYFPSLERVVVRKHRMLRFTSYCSFSIFANAKSGSNLKMDDFVNFDWPDDIRCYPHSDNPARRV